MELEKTLFRVHERVLTGKYISNILLFLIVTFMTISAYFLIFFVILNASQEGKPQCINFHQNQSLLNETLYEVTVYDGSKIRLTMLLSQMKELITMNPTIRDAHNYTKISESISYECYKSVPSLVLQVTNTETLFLNDVVSTFRKEVVAKNNDTNETWYWNDRSLIKYQDIREENLVTKIINTIFTLFRICLGIFIQSAVASIYIKMTIICAPVFIVMMSDCMSIFGNREIQPQILARAFPWIGQYLNLLQRNQRPKTSLLNAFFFMLLLYYFIYLSCVFIGTLLLFYKSTPKGLDEDFFGLIAINEFMCMLFLRTRTSLYFVPKFIIIYYIAFLFYVQQSCYGFFYPAFVTIVCLSFATYAIFLYFFEVPSLTWNPLSPYTPTVDRPRCFYQPLFQMNWMNDIPQIWTMFYPLHGRRFFQVQNLALVDRNFPLLNNVLQQQDVEMQEVAQQ